MKNLVLPLFLSGAWLSLFATSSAFATDLYFRPEASGGYPANGGTYTWNTSSSHWYTGAAGGTGQNWDNSAPGNALMSTANGAFSVLLTEDITTKGIGIVGTVAAAAVITFSSSNTSDPVTLTFAPGSIIQSTSSSGRRLVFSEMDIAGDFSVAGRVSFNNVDFSGTITNTSTGILQLSNQTTANVVMTAGSVLEVQASSASLSKLSGTGGTIRRAQANGTLTLNQASNTVWGGDLGGSAANFKFTKSGVGTLIMNGGASHAIEQAVTVSEGSLYSNGTLAAGGNLTVASGANLGGTMTSNKSVVLSASSSIITPGMASLDDQGNVKNQAGVLTLNAGLSGANGGTFNFYLDGNDGNDGLLNSRIDITGGTVNLLGNKTVNLFGLGAGLLESGVAYTLFDADLATTRSEGWNAGWSLNANTTGYTVASFGFVGNELQVVFTIVPEPAGGILLVGGLLFLLVLENRRRRAICRLQ